MDEMTAVIVIAGLPFYAMTVIAVAYGMSYCAHMLRRIDQSAVETKATEGDAAATTK